jgi:hypothetical protein
MSGAEGALPLRLHMNLDESGMTTVQRGCSGFELHDIFDRDTLTELNVDVNVYSLNASREFRL